MRPRHHLSPPSVALAVGVLVLLTAPAVHATYPGTSGRIAYNTISDDSSLLTMIWPDGSGKATAAVAGLCPTWSPDGSDAKLLVFGGGKTTWSPEATHPRIASYRAFRTAAHSVDRSEGPK